MSGPSRDRRRSLTARTMPRRKKKAAALPTYGPRDLGEPGVRVFPSSAGVYQIQFRDPDRRPVRKTRTLRTESPAEAVERARALIRKKSLGTFDPWAQAATQTPIGHAADLYLAHLRRLVDRGDRKPATLRTAGERVGWLLERTGRHVPLAHVERRDVEHVVYNGKTGPRAEATRYSMHLSLAGFFNWCVAEGIVRASPIEGAPSPPKPDRHPGYLTRAQLDQWVAAVEAAARALPAKRRAQLPHAVVWVRDACLLAACTGLRLGELCALRWRDVERGEDGAPSWLHVRETVGRGGRHSPKWDSRGRVPVPPAARAVLGRMRARAVAQGDPEGPVARNASGGEVHPEQLSRAFKRYATKAKLPGSLSFHSLRHTYASWLVEAGKEITTVRDLMRHKDVSTTQVYAHLSPAHLKASVDDVFGAPEEEKRGAADNVCANGTPDAAPAAASKSAPTASFAPLFDLSDA